MSRAGQAVTQQRWRQGSRVPHHVYAQRGEGPDRRPWPDGDPPIATFQDPADAMTACLAVNSQSIPVPRTVTGCVFCGIIAETEPAQVIREWGDAVAFVPFSPVVAGHVLVVPRVHVQDAVESPVITALTMARAAELAAEYSASNILTSVGRAATQSVMHLHLHIVPRAGGDQLMAPWGTTGDPHEPHRCAGMDRLAAELAELRSATVGPLTTSREVWPGAPNP